MDTDVSPCFFRLPPENVAVVLVDFQNDFCSPAASDRTPPGNSNNAAAAYRANDFARQSAAAGAHVIYTQQVLDFDQLTRRQQSQERPDGLCVKGSWGAELFVEPVPGSLVTTKHRFDCWQSAEFTDAIEKTGVDGLVICGVELVCCVLYAVQGASERGFDYVIPEDLVSGQNAGDETDNKAVRDYFRYNQPERVIDSGQAILDRWAGVA